MKIREAIVQDLPSLLELYRILNPEDENISGSKHAEKTWGQILEDKKMHCFVGEKDNRLVASCMLAILPNLTRGGRPFGVVQNVITHPNYRGHGIGSQMLKYVNKFAWDLDCYQVLLQTGRDKTLDFYRRCGYRDDVKTGFVAKPQWAAT